MAAQMRNLEGALEGVSLLTTLSGERNAGVIEGLTARNGIRMGAAPTMESQAPEAPKTAMNFLQPQRNA